MKIELSRREIELILVALSKMSKEENRENFVKVYNHILSQIKNK